MMSALYSLVLVQFIIYTTVQSEHLPPDYVQQGCVPVPKCEENTAGTCVESEHACTNGDGSVVPGYYCPHGKACCQQNPCNDDGDSCRSASYCELHQGIQVAGECPGSKVCCKLGTCGGGDRSCRAKPLCEDHLGTIVSGICKTQRFCCKIDECPKEHQCLPQGACTADFGTIVSGLCGADTARYCCDIKDCSGHDRECRTQGACNAMSGNKVEGLCTGPKICCKE